MLLRFRKLHDTIPLRRAKLQVPGWSGNATHATPQPWHCKPFIDAASYGLELRFCWQASCRVSLQRGRAVWSGDLSAELPPDAPTGWHPFSAFAQGYFGLSPLLDLQVPDGMGLFVLPHPRCLMDASGTAPIAIPGLVETHWWPRPFFLVFKAPAPRKHIEFRHGDPIAQLVVVPLAEKYDIEEMDVEAALDRNRRSLTLARHGCQFSSRTTDSEDGYPSFDNKYKVLSECASSQGVPDVNVWLDDPVASVKGSRRAKKKSNGKSRGFSAAMESARQKNK